MVALNFPNTPNPGDTFLTWRWDGVKWSTTGIHIDAPEDGQLYARQNGSWVTLPEIDIGTAAQLRASIPAKVIDTSGLQGALDLVTVASVSGTYTPDFHQFINLRLNLVGNTTLAFPAVSINDLQGRSGLLITYHGAASTLSFGGNYGLHKNQAPDMTTGAGTHNIFSYSIWNPARIAIGLIAGGLS